jgi:hypothetical protein
MAARKGIWYDKAAKMFKQITSPDTIDASVESTASQVLNVTNGNAGSIVIGNAVYLSAAGTVDLARANASGTIACIGLVKDASIATTATGDVVTSGKITATTGEWDTVTGGTGGLTAGTKYYVSKATAGMLIDDISAFTTGDYVVFVGTAVSTTEMNVAPFEMPILL